MAIVDQALLPDQEESKIRELIDALAGNLESTENFAAAELDTVLTGQGPNRPPTWKKVASASVTFNFGGVSSFSELDGKAVKEQLPDRVAWTDEANIFEQINSFQLGLLTDTIGELTVAAGITLQHQLLAEGGILTDAIDERTSAVGVTIEGILHKAGVLGSNITNVPTLIHGSQVTAINIPGEAIRLAATLNEAASGTHAYMAGVRIPKLALIGGAADVTVGVTLRIEGAPSFADDNYALWVVADESRFDGIVTFGADPVIVKANPTLIFNATTTTPSFIQFNSTPTIADALLARITARWAGTDVADIDWRTGADTGNKDEGRLRIRTAGSGGVLADAITIDEIQDVKLPNGRIQVKDGNPSVPGFGFIDDPDVGMYRVGTNRGAVVAGATSCLEWSNTNTTVFMNRVEELITAQAVEFAHGIRVSGFYATEKAAVATNLVVGAVSADRFGVKVGLNTNVADAFARFAVFGSASNTHTTGTVSELGALKLLASVSQAGTTAVVVGIKCELELFSPAVVTDAYGIRIFYNVQSATITNQYGLKIDNVTGGGTLNFAIHTGSGLVRFGDEVDTTEFYKVDGTQVVTTRITGWTAPTGVATRSGFATGDPPSNQVLAEHLKALIDDLTSHGLIGA